MGESQGCLQLRHLVLSDIPLWGVGQCSGVESRGCSEWWSVVLSQKELAGSGTSGALTLVRIFTESIMETELKFLHQ